MRILKIVVSGFRKLEDNFTIDFISNKVPRKANDDNELTKVFSNTYSSIYYSIIGGNGQGKTTTLSLILMCYELINERKVRYNRLNFAKEKIELQIFIAEYQYMYNYRCTIYPSNQTIFNQSYCRIERKWLMYKKVKKFHPSTFYKGKFYKVRENLIPERKVTPVFKIFQLSRSEMLLKIIKMYEVINHEVFLKVFQLFEPNVENIKLSEDKEHFFVKSKGNIIKLSISEFSSIMSFGTLKGVLLYLTAYFALKYGAVLIVDEIESSLNTQIVINFLKLFINHKTNPHSSTIYFSTYNTAILDLFNRTESIYVVSKTSQDDISIKSLTEHIGTKIRGYKSRVIDRYECKNNQNYILSEDFIYFLRYK